MQKCFLGIISILLLFGCNQEDNLETKINSIFSEFNDETPGVSVAVRRDNKIIYQRGFGLADLAAKVKIEPKTNFRLASITKQFTALSIMLLENEGELSFDDPIGKFFPKFPVNESEITIQNILQHTSGILDYENYMSDTLTIPLKDQDVLEILLEQDSTYFPPGTLHKYSNSGYAILALIIEKISGKSYAEFLDENIFTPLGMNNSIAFENGISTISNRAFGYANSDSGFVFSDQSLTSAVLGDGGIYSSTTDLLKWNESIENATLLKKEKLSLAFQKTQLPDGKVADYGFGWRLDPYRNIERKYHTGSTCGFSNIYMKLPEFNLTVIVLINIRDYDAKGYAEKIADLFIK